MAGPYLELEEKLRPRADPRPRPRPGDWLAEHDEPGQTFAEYLEARPVRKSDHLHTIYLGLVGDFGEARRRILDLTRDYLALFFDCPAVSCWPGPISSCEFPACLRRVCRCTVCAR